MVKAESAKQVFENICSRFVPEKAGPADRGAFAFDLGGEKYWALIEGGACAAGEGDGPTAPDITVRSTPESFVALVNGELNPMIAITTGKIKVQGNMGMALKMIGWFDLS